MEVGATGTKPTKNMDKMRMIEEQTTDHPIRLLLHGFSSPVNRKMSAICSYVDNPLRKLLLEGQEHLMMLQLHKWEIAGRPGYCLWLPRENLFSLGY